jgi:plastocyanin
MRIEEAIASVINQACLSISQQGLQIPFDYDYCHNDNFRAALEKAVEENPSLYQHIISMSESYFSKYNNTYENNNPINSIQFRGPPAYSPQSVTVKTGTTIEWTNYDKYPHSVTSGTIGGGPTPMFDSSVLDQNQSYKFTFNKPGIFPYYDTISNIMSGVVIVK